MTYKMVTRIKYEELATYQSIKSICVPVRVIFVKTKHKNKRPGPTHLVCQTMLAEVPALHYPFSGYPEPTSAHCIVRLRSAYNLVDRASHLRSGLHVPVSGLSSEYSDCSDLCAVNEGCIKILEHRNYLIDVLNIHGDVELLLLPSNAIPDSLNHLCDSSIQNLYSRSGRLQYIDIFIHVYRYIAQFLKLIDPLRSCQQLPSGCV